MSMSFSPVGGDFAGLPRNVARLPANLRAAQAELHRGRPVYRAAIDRAYAYVESFVAMQQASVRVRSFDDLFRTANLEQSIIAFLGLKSEAVLSSSDDLSAEVQALKAERLLTLITDLANSLAEATVIETWQGETCLAWSLLGMDRSLLTVWAAGLEPDQQQLHLQHVRSFAESQLEEAALCVAAFHIANMLAPLFTTAQGSERLAGIALAYLQGIIADFSMEDHDEQK